MPWTLSCSNQAENMRTKFTSKDLESILKLGQVANTRHLKPYYEEKKKQEQDNASLTFHFQEINVTKSVEL